jgi:NADPH:quinone reductase-like Zn-dependent oxidoreductase
MHNNNGRKYKNNNNESFGIRTNWYPADVLEVKEVDTPSPKEGEVLVKVLHSPIDPADTFFIPMRLSS